MIYYKIYNLKFFIYKYILVFIVLLIANARVLYSLFDYTGISSTYFSNLKFLNLTFIENDSFRGATQYFLIVFIFSLFIVLLLFLFSRSSYSIIVNDFYIEIPDINTRSGDRIRVKKDEIEKYQITEDLFFIESKSTKISFNPHLTSKQIEYLKKYLSMI